MKTWLARLATLAGLLALGGVAHFFLAPRGLAWVVWTAGALVLAFFVTELVLRARRRATERRDRARWAEAMHDAATRRAAIRELRSRVDRARRIPRLRVQHARLARTLAELHEADGRAEEAVKVLAKVDVEALDPLPAAVIRLARAQAYLALADAEGAAATLGPLGAGTGDEAVDAFLAIARGHVALLEGDAPAALAAARAEVERATRGDAVWDEAVALEALASDDRARLEALSDDARARLRAIGPPALRAMLERA